MTVNMPMTEHSAAEISEDNPLELFSFFSNLLFLQKESWRIRERFSISFSCPIKNER